MKRLFLIAAMGLVLIKSLAAQSPASAAEPAAEQPRAWRSIASHP